LQRQQQCRQQQLMPWLLLLLLPCQTCWLYLLPCQLLCQ
jgi:hypothetical protein